mgnify:CR=1 FL=1
MTKIGRMLFEDGMKEGRSEERKKTAERLLEKGIDMDVIMDVCDKITVINFGTQIATGAPESIQSNPDVIAAYLGENES